MHHGLYVLYAYDALYLIGDLLFDSLDAVLVYAIMCLSVHQVMLIFVLSTCNPVDNTTRSTRPIDFLHFYRHS
jgi:hypothetical protein